MAAYTPLSADEAYYWVWSHALAEGYLDHPPMIAVWIRIGTFLAGETALGVRLLGPLAAAAGSWLLAATAEALFPGRRLGIPAAVILNATLMLGVGAVTMTPDTPLVFFVAAALWALARVQRDGRWWLLVGVSLGLAMDSKYTAVLIAAGIPLWLAWVPPLRREFRRPWLWIGGALAALLFVPVLAWNARHGWASFLRQGGRTGDWHPAAAGKYLGELLVSQVGLITPLLFVLFAAGLVAAVRAAWVRRDVSWTLLAATSLPGLLVFLQHALGDRVQANWLAVLYPPLAIGAAACGIRWWRAASGLGFALTALVYLQGAAAPFALPRRLDPTLIRLGGWDGLAQQADALRQANGLGYLASEEYGTASLLAWWAPPGTKVMGAEPRWRLFDLPPGPSGTGLLLISQRRSEPPDPALWQQAELIGTLARGRGGVEAEAFRVYRVVLRQGAPAAQLPRPGG